MNNEFWAEIEEISLVAEETFQVTFKSDSGSFTFSPGQYIWVDLTKLSFPDEKGERRAFSISSAVSDSGSFSIHFRNSNSGYKKTLISLKKGDRVKMIGPFGSSYVPTKNHKRIVMIAGGIGITPFLSILRSIHKTQDNNHYSVIHLSSSAKKQVFYDELLSITTVNKFPFVSHIGRISESLFPSSVDFANDTFFICGPQGMVEEVNRILISKGVPSEHMHFEQYYPSSTENLTEEDFILKPNERNIMLQAVQDSRNHVIITDFNGQIIFANKKAQTNTGFTFAEMRGNTPRLWGGLMSKDFYQQVWRKKRDSAGFDGEIMNRRKNGEIYYVLAHISPIVNDNGSVIGYIGTEEDITTEKQVDKAKTEFISLASHQLRTPLSTINWYCEMLLSGDAGDLSEEQKKFVAEAYFGSQRMSKLVSALLNVSRIETGMYMVDPELVDIVKAVRSVLDESKPQIDEKKLSIVLEKEEIPMIMLDPNLTLIILQNLLTNSIKYTREGGNITIQLKHLKKGDSFDNESLNEDSLLIKVEDNGIGIPQSQIGQIFQKLFRADNVRRSNTDGTGLGLYLVKSLIEHSAGKIWFTSKEGEGTTFFVLLPLTGMPKKEGIKKLEQIGVNTAYGI